MAEPKATPPAARAPSDRYADPQIHDRGDRGGGGVGHLFRPAGADAVGAGGADVVRLAPLVADAAPSQAGPCPGGAAEPGPGAGDPLGASAPSWARNSPGSPRNCPATRPISAHKIQSIRGPTGHGTIAALNQTIENLAEQITGGPRPAKPAASPVCRRKKSRCRW